MRAELMEAEQRLLHRSSTRLASVDSSGTLFFLSRAAFTLSISFPAAACRAAELGTLSSRPLTA